MTLPVGIDVSRWDSPTDTDGTPLKIPVDWQAYTRAGWMPAFIKVSEGTVMDLMFPVQWAAGRGKVHRSGYHYFRPFVDPIAAADKFIDLIGDDVGEMPPVLDLETKDNLSSETVAKRALQWLDRYRVRMGRNPIVYSSPYFLDLIESDRYPQFANYPLWLAAYPFDKWSADARAAKIKRVLTGQDIFIPYSPIPAPWREITFQQWTAFGSPLDVPGYYTGPGGKEAVDFNFYLGQDLFEQFDLSPINLEIPMSNYTVTTIKPNMSIRADHNTGADKISSVPNIGTVLGASEIWTAPANLFNNVGVQINKIGDQWARLDTAGWIAITHLGVQYCSFKQNPTPPPAPSFPETIEEIQTLIMPNGERATYKGTLTKQ